MLGYTPTPPPQGARRLTARPADPQGLGQPRGGEGSPPPPLWGGGGPPPTPQPPKLSHTPRGHTLAGGGPRAPANQLSSDINQLLQVTTVWVWPRSCGECDVLWRASLVSRPADPVL